VSKKQSEGERIVSDACQYIGYQYSIVFDTKNVRVYARDGHWKRKVMGFVSDDLPERRVL
jgi:hypothetical protein